MGNILGVLDKNGKLVVRYRYDAWGKHKTECLDKVDGKEVFKEISGSISEEYLGYKTFAANNPFRYRSYYYDTETGLYFLQTRYYDPEIGRFITIDDISYLAPDTINGLNLYVYCNNNPVMNVDPEGTKWWEFWKWDWAAIGSAIVVGLAVAGTAALAICTGGLAGVAIMSVALGMAFGAIGGGISAYNSGTSITAGIWGGAIKGGAIGFAVGLGIATGAGALTVGEGLLAFASATVLNFSAGVLNYTIDNSLNGRALNFKDSLSSGAMQMLSGIFAFSAGMIIGVSGFYNIPRTTKLFSGTWFGNIAFGQFIKFITYYPFNWVFNFWQKTYFRGD